MNIWKFPYLYRLTDYSNGFIKIEKLFLGLKLVAWNVESELWVRIQLADLKEV